MKKVTLSGLFELWPEGDIPEIAAAKIYFRLSQTWR